jgi:hypothetical protein
LGFHPRRFNLSDSDIIGGHCDLLVLDEVI